MQGRAEGERTDILTDGRTSEASGGAGGPEAEEETDRRTDGYGVVAVSHCKLMARSQARQAIKYRLLTALN